MLSLILSLFLVSPSHADVSVPRAKQYVWSVYDVAVSGGQSVPHSLGVSVPAGAIITNAWVYINTQFAAAGTESLGISCLGTQNIMFYNTVKSVPKDRMFSAGVSNSVYTGAGNLIPENASPLALNAGYVSVPSACGLTVDVRGDSGYTPYSAGKATIILEYFKL